LELALATRDVAAPHEAQSRTEFDIALDAARSFYKQLYPQTLVALSGHAAAIESRFAKLRQGRKRSGGEVSVKSG